MTLPLNHSKDRAKLMAEYQIAIKQGSFVWARILKQALERNPPAIEFNTQSTDSGG